MNKGWHGNGGFMKVLVMGTVAICVIFILFYKSAQYFESGVLSSSRSGSTSFDSYSSQTNPLLDFGIGGFDGSGGTYVDPIDRTVTNTDGRGASPYARQISLSSGNARSAYQTYEEYVSIRNTGEPVNITGWTLTNSKGTRPVENISVSYAYPAQESATIGQGTEFLSPTGVFETGPIILANGDTAILTTGRPLAQYSFSIYTSFRENMCMGYLRNYTFTPSINKSCPYLSQDPFIRTVTDQCYDYIRSLSRCELPATEDEDRYEEELTSQCRAFIDARVGYANCVALNKDVPGFSGSRWRVFLSKDRELWAKDRETITLYDSNGLVVDQVSY